jgi:hypothetical protein
LHIFFAEHFGYAETTAIDEHVGLESVHQGSSVSTCNAVPYQNCQAGGWVCNVPAQVDSSAVYLTGLQLDGVPLSNLSVSADPSDPTPSEAVDIEVDPSQAWTLTGNVRFTWVSANGYPPKETRIMFSATGQNIPCIDEDEDGYFVEGVGCAPVDCDDANADVNPGAAEICNGIDDNCDGLVDEGCSSCSGTAAASTYGASPVYGPSGLGKHLGSFLFPVGAVLAIRIWRRKK